MSIISSDFFINGNTLTVDFARLYSHDLVSKVEDFSTKYFSTIS